MQAEVVNGRQAHILDRILQAFVLPLVIVLGLTIISFAYVPAISALVSEGFLALAILGFLVGEIRGLAFVCVPATMRSSYVTSRPRLYGATLVWLNLWMILSASIALLVLRTTLDGAFVWSRLVATGRWYFVMQLAAASLIGILPVRVYKKYDRGRHVGD
jgi:hypothetical protein